MDRFWSKVGQVGNSCECWPWLGAKTFGYGRYQLRGRSALAHRVAYEQLSGPIPDGLHLDHLCRNRECVNPAHLEPVTLAENSFRARKNACRHGHPYSPENTRIKRDGYKVCKTCHRNTERNARRWRNRRTSPSNSSKVGLQT